MVLDALKANGNMLKPGDHVLDCPCGLGFQAEELARNGLVVTAMDASQDNVEFSEKEHRSGAKFKTGTFSEIPSKVPKGSQDAVFCFKESFGYEETPELNMRHLQSMFDALKEDGSMVLTWLYTPSYYAGRKPKGNPIEDVEKMEIPEKEIAWITAKNGERIGQYRVTTAPKKRPQVIPDEFIPETGFKELKGNSPTAIENRTVRAYGRQNRILIRNGKRELQEEGFEIREYFKPIQANKNNGKNAPIGGTHVYYDLPLMRALCEHAGFVDVQCVPARVVNDAGNPMESTWAVAIVAKKPSSKKINSITSAKGWVKRTFGF